MNIVDTSGWIEYFFSGANVSFFSTPIEDTDNLLVPVVCLYEIFKKVIMVADEAKALQVIAQMKQGRVVDLTEDIALRAALVSIKHKLPMADKIRGHAHGIIAIGDIAKGWIAIGAVARGGLAIGGFALGIVALGGLSVIGARRAEMRHPTGGEFSLADGQACAGQSTSDFICWPGTFLV